MSEHDDDLARWADDDLVRALRAPGTAHELADQEQYVAAFRETNARKAGLRSLPRRAAGRLGAGGTAVVVTLTLSSGVAAAYTGNLPDQVQSVVHSVLGPVGAPAPDGPTHRVASAGSTHGGTVVVPPSSGTTSTTDPSDPTAPTSGATPSTGTGQTTPGHGSTDGPTTEPTTDPSSSPTSDPGSGSAATGMTMGATTHRVLVGQPITLSSLVTAADGTPVAGQPVVLQVRGVRHWRPVATGTTDSTGVVSVSTPPVTRTASFRWHTVPRVHSTPWRVRMVPTLAVTADVGGATTVLSASTDGGRPGDRVQLLRRVGHSIVGGRRGRLDPSGSISFQLPTPQRSSVYVVRLLPTRRHAPARARVVVQPPIATSVGISSSSHRVGFGGSLTMSGVVSAADGAAIAGRRVTLQVRGPKRWRSVGSSTSDASGSVAIATPAARVTIRYRFRAPNGVHSLSWRVVMVPTIDASATADGTIDGSASGGRTGDRVILLRRMGGRLVKVQTGRLDSSGHVTFSVVPKPHQTAYVVRLLATKRHGWAVAHATVPGTG